MTGVPSASARAALPWIGAAALVASPLALGGLGVLTEYGALMAGFGCVYAIAALSLNLLSGYAGQVSLGHAAFLGIGAYASGWVTWTHERPFALGLLVAILAGAASALVVGFPALRVRGLNLAVLTLALGLGTAAYLFRLRAISGAGAGLTLPRPNINGYVLTDNREYLVIVLAVLVGAIWIDRNLARTKLGRSLHALSEDEQVAASFGIDVARAKIAAFALSGALAGAAGCLFGHLLGVAQVQTFDLQLSLTLVMVVVLGGLGSRTGAVAAGLGFGILPRAFTALSGWDLVLGPLFIAATLARHPGGLAEQARGIARHRHRSPRPVHGDGPDLEPALPAQLTFRTPDEPSAPTGDADAPALAVHDLQVAFGGLRVLEGLSFAVPRGEITGLVGPNGAGKSTVLNVVSGFVPAQRGRIELGGVDLTDRSAHQRAAAGIGRTFQLVGLAKSLSVRDNLLLAQHLRAGYPAVGGLVAMPRARQVERDLRREAEASAHALGFGDRLDRRLGELSHGQQRIVEIACALSTRPQVLLLDEPTAGLSPKAVEALAVALTRLRDELGQTVVVVEHHLAFVSATCAEVLVLADGSLLSHGAPDDVLAERVVVDAYLGGVA